MRLVFIDTPHPDGWYGTGALAGFGAIAGEMVRRGHEVAVAAFAHWALGHGHWPKAVERLRVPLIERPAIEVAPGGLGNGRAMYDALCVAEWLAQRPFDAVLAPGRGGLAAYLAMTAATAPALRHPAIALWAPDSTRGRLLADPRPATLADLVSDALERTALSAGDRVFVPEGAGMPRRRGTAAMPVPPLMVEDAEPAEVEAITDIAFAGDMGEASGALLFMDSIERLQGRGLMDGRSVTFVGPLRSAGLGLSRETIAVRARGWSFPWTARPDMPASEAARFLAAPGRLAVFAAAQAGFPELFAAVVAAGGRTLAPRSPLTRRIVAAGTPAAGLFQPGSFGLAKGLEAAIAGPGAPIGRPARSRADIVAHWADRLEALAAAPQSARRRRSRRVTSVCVVHRDRPVLLARALASIEIQMEAGEIEIVLVDDASRTEAALAALSEIESGRADRSFKLLRNSEPCFPAAARNQAAAAARGSCLVFLDDDNWLLPGGLGRLADAVASGRYDVVTSALDVEQPGVAQGTPPLRRIFLGDAGVAGLVFNGFGDASLAVDRRAFERVGGFPAEGIMAPAEDWVFLARCRAAGLRIATLATPCFGFRKPVDLEQTSWRRRHREGALSRVREAYGDLAGEELALALSYLQGLDLAGREGT